ncbi:E3 ubiquitin protein ligase DRIP2-like [Capsella rubella]|uniref:E3 ubiquitin protein ligase DRIP2-like n=1 Tax=Capsella rubella TaxID=81985 RepID=UPI000CD49D3A|nr:E3 ubiquitin protein ligase DRIP2-like [Capsella rubella]
MDEDLCKLYSCVICTNLFDEATALKRCRHIFCFNCIHGKIVEHDWHCCPICYADFGPDPLMRLSHDDPLLVSREMENIPSSDDENMEVESEDVDEIWDMMESETTSDEYTDSDMEMDSESDD